MKKFLPLFVLLLAMILAACGQSAKPLPEETEAVSAGEEQPNDTQGTDKEEEVIPAPLLPEFSEEELAIPVPDFLDEEQQALYRHAQSLFHARWELGFCDDTQPSEEDESILLDDYDFRYSPVKGRYQDWNYFYKVMMSVFTEELFDEMNAVGSNPLYVEYEGVTYGTDFAPVNVIWTETDEAFTLIYKEDNCVEFEITAYGVEPYTDDKITRTGSMKMVKLEDGTWRVAVFHCPDCPDETIRSENADAPALA